MFVDENAFSLDYVRVRNWKIKTIYLEKEEI